VAVTCRRPVAVAALVGTESVLTGGLIAASAGPHGPVDTVHSLLAAGALWFVGDSVRERRRYLAACREQEAQRQADHAGSRSAKSGSGSPGSCTTWWPTR
jgi:hypothetical protein